MELEAASIDPRQPFTYYGLGSVQAVSLTGDLEVFLNRKLSPTLAWDYPTIELLANYLADEPQPSKQVKPTPAPVQTFSRSVNEPIAIIGLSCRFPGAPNPRAFWELLRNGVDAISEVPSDRWDVDDFHSSDPAPGKVTSRWGGFLDDVDLFDPHFFGISPREAARMDPQQRLLLEVSWEALENAFIPPASLAGSRTGVFVGISSYDYSRLQFDDPERIDAYAGTGNAHSIAANRLSYLFDLRGPSMAIDTACSSSLVAAHLACQSLRTGRIRPGVGRRREPHPDPRTDHHLLAGTHALSRWALQNIRCPRRWLCTRRRLRRYRVSSVSPMPCAMEITSLRLIRGSAVNQDGRSNGLTAPNGLAQQDVIRQALQNAQVASASDQLCGSAWDRHAARRPDRNGVPACRAGRGAPRKQSW